VRRFPRLRDKEDLGNFPLSGEIVQEKDGVEQLGKVFRAGDG
jgi:hypothetical protein